MFNVSNIHRFEMQKYRHVLSSLSLNIRPPQKTQSHMCSTSAHSLCNSTTRRQKLTLSKATLKSLSKNKKTKGIYNSLAKGHNLKQQETINKQLRPWQQRKREKLDERNRLTEANKLFPFAITTKKRIVASKQEADKEKLAATRIYLNRPTKTEIYYQQENKKQINHMAQTQKPQHLTSAQNAQKCRPVHFLQPQQAYRARQIKDNPCNPSGRCQRGNCSFVRSTPSRVSEQQINKKEAQYRIGSPIDKLQLLQPESSSAKPSILQMKNRIINALHQIPTVETKYTYSEGTPRLEESIILFQGSSQPGNFLHKRLFQETPDIKNSQGSNGQPSSDQKINSSNSKRLINGQDQTKQYSFFFESIQFGLKLVRSCSAELLLLREQKSGSIYGLMKMGDMQKNVIHTNVLSLYSKLGCEWWLTPPFQYSLKELIAMGKVHLHNMHQIVIVISKTVLEVGKEGYEALDIKRLIRGTVYVHNVFKVAPVFRVKSMVSVQWTNRVHLQGQIKHQIFSMIRQLLH